MMLSLKATCETLSSERVKIIPQERSMMSEVIVSKGNVQIQKNRRKPWYKSNNNVWFVELKGIRVWWKSLKTAHKVRKKQSLCSKLFQVTQRKVKILSLGNILFWNLQKSCSGIMSNFLPLNHLRASCRSNVLSLPNTCMCDLPNENSKLAWMHSCIESSYLSTFSQLSYCYS